MQVEDLKVYQRLTKLALSVHELTLSFPKFEMYELGSQLRRSSNSAPANLAEGFGNKHTKIYTETISRAQGEIRETKHHLYMVYQKGYLDEKKYFYYKKEYGESSKMLFGLDVSLSQATKGKVFY